MAVVFYHADRMVPRGYLAVDLFFALSGFVLYHAYAHRMQPGRFLIERTVRLGPLMVAGAAVGLAINGGSLLTLLMIPTGDALLYPANVPLWTLLFEFIAGAVFAVFFRRGRLAWALAIALGAAGTIAGILAMGSADLGFHWGSFTYGMARTAFAFAIGIGIYKLVERYPVDLGGAWFMLPLLLPFAVMMPAGWPVVIDFVAVFLVMPLCVWFGAICRLPHARVAAWLGVPSYALYAVHHPLVKADFSAWITIPAAIALAVVLAYLYDPPIRRALGNWLLRCESAPA